MARIDITERVAAQNVINDPRLRGKPLHVQAKLPTKDFRLFVGSKTQAGTGDALKRNLEKAIRTGVFKADFFTQPQAVSAQATFLPSPLIQKLAPASVRALEQQGILKTRAQVKKQQTVQEKVAEKRFIEAQKRGLDTTSSVGKVKAQKKSRKKRELKRLVDARAIPFVPGLTQKLVDEGVQVTSEGKLFTEKQVLGTIRGLTAGEAAIARKTPDATEFLFGTRNPLVRGEETFTTTKKSVEGFGKDIGRDIFGQGLGTTIGGGAGALGGTLAGGALGFFEGTFGTASKFLGAFGQQVSGPFKIQTPFTVKGKIGNFLLDSGAIERAKFQPGKGSQVIVTEKTLGAILGLIPDLLLIEGRLAGKVISKVPRTVEKAGEFIGSKRITRFGTGLGKAEGVGAVEQVLEVTKETRKGIRGDIVASQVFDVKNIFGKARIQAAAKGIVEAKEISPIGRVPVVQDVFVEGGVRKIGPVSTIKTTFVGEVVAQKVPRAIPGKKLVPLTPAGKPVRIIDIGKTERLAKETFGDISTVIKPRKVTSVSIQEAQEIISVGKGKAGVIAGREIGVLGVPPKIELGFGKTFTTAFQDLSKDVSLALTKSRGRTDDLAFRTKLETEVISIIKKPSKAESQLSGRVGTFEKILPGEPTFGKLKAIEKPVIVDAGFKISVEPLKGVSKVSPKVVSPVLKQEAILKGFQETSQPIFQSSGGTALLQQAISGKVVTKPIAKPGEQLQSSLSLGDVKTKQLFGTSKGEPVSFAEKTLFGPSTIQILKPVAGVSPGGKQRVSELQKIEEVLNISEKQRVPGVTKLGERTRIGESNRIKEQIKAQQDLSFKEATRLENLIKPIEGIGPAQRVRQEQRLRLTENLRLVEKTGLVDDPFPDFTVPLVPPPKIPLLGVGLDIPGFKREIPLKKQQGFNVFAKSKGKFSKLNKTGSLIRTDAKNLGGLIVDGSSSAQFRLRKSKKAPVKPEFASSSFSFRSGKFRSPIRKGKSIADPNVFIEKNAFRIDSPGELNQITAQGLLAIKRKKSKQNVFAF